MYFPEFDTPDQNNGIATDLDYERSKKLFIKGEAGPLSLMLGYAERKKGVPTASYEQIFNDPRSNTVDEQTFLNIGYQTRLNEVSSLRAKAFYNRYQYTGDYIYDEGGGSTSHDHEKSNASWWGGELELLSTYFNRHKLLAGLHFQKNNPIEQKSWSIESSSLDLDLHDSNHQTSLYVQDEVSIGENWLLNFGVRYDNHSAIEKRGVTLPRIGLIYRATPETTMKALYGKAYRTPNAYELYFEIPGEGGAKVNPDLQPEYIKAYELVLEHKISVTNNLRLSVYQNDVTDLITQVLDPDDDLLVYQNIGHAKAKGFEVEWLRYCPCGIGSIWRTSYSWQSVKDGTTGENLTNAPRHLVKAHVALPIPESKWRVGVQANYVAPRNTEDGRVGGYAIANLTLLSEKLVKNTEISASVYNPFDRTYADPAGDEFGQDSLEQNGRSWRIKVNYRF